MAIFKALGTILNIGIVGGSVALIYTVTQATIVPVLGLLFMLGIQGLITPIAKPETDPVDLPNGVGFWGWLAALLFWPAFVIVVPLHIMRRNRYLKQQAKLS